MGGAALAPDLLRRVKVDFPCPMVYTCFGMTELSSLIALMHENDSIEKQTRTAGRVFPNYVSALPCHWSSLFSDPFR